MMTTRTIIDSDPAFSWIPDVELPGYEQLTIALPDEPTYAFEQVGSLVATLIRRNSPRSSKAVLYVHGWSDYFFQTHLADEMAGLGYDFYAIDLRRYGRSLRSKQLAGYITELDDYFVELDEALEVIKAEGHQDIVLMGHSTGGLTASLYADARPGAFKAVVLNSPWLELQGNALLRPAMQPMLALAGRLAPTNVLSIPETGFYLRSISAKQEGEWRYNHNLKGDPAFLVRVGWMAAILRGHARVEVGLAIDCPVLVAISKRTDYRKEWDEALHYADTILDVERIAARAPKLGDTVVLNRINGGKHDLVLSLSEPRRVAFEVMKHFLASYS